MANSAYANQQLMAAEGKLAGAITALASQLAVAERLGKRTDLLTAPISKLQDCRKTVTAIRRERDD
jgi:hypothetical protein